MAEAAKKSDSTESREEQSFRQNQEMYHHLAYSRDHYQLKAIHWAFLLFMGSLTLGTLGLLILSHVPATKKYIFQTIDFILGI
ncbi:MAG: hypothetical protein COW00_10030 [Bdellovibrio sp. CG12_big_fil_rev_8_21_14_0_65_39_13]|nr:MAG: hypothetical protein COW78_01285 [Bdellovibrio sp. CG22_combo_CG10-13_8_21_14_all_39_27]PIQ59449.1 MAG: hypothetical protein COW00_10030 [Bdellovibrio sp. CG12_big_fil_rev_8_21_14_0_65_39_13]PIR36579.1 MAG: hypothetical protein COV37_02760 [Bdellovibrio sp. CG11_big_fil_rev_8_21_14_0_20_39_38]